MIWINEGNFPIKSLKKPLLENQLLLGFPVVSINKKLLLQTLEIAFILKRGIGSIRDLKSNKHFKLVLS